MIMWNRNFLRNPWEINPEYAEVVVKYGRLEWVLPLCVARTHLKYNPRHLPVVIREPENEDYYLRMSIRRLLNGYRVRRAPPSPFVQE